MGGINDWIASKSWALSVVGGLLTFGLVLLGAIKDGIQLSDWAIVSAGFVALVSAIGWKAKTDEIAKAVDVAKK